MNEIFSIQQLINNQIRKENDSREKKEQLGWYVSSLGSCLCGTYLSRLGLKPDKEFDDRILRVFKVGKQTEDWIIDLIKKQEGYKALDQTLLVDDDLNLRGKYDLHLQNINTGKELIYEIKSKHSKSFWYMDKKGEGAAEQHKMQLWTYLYLAKIKEGRIVYVSKDDLSILEYPIFLKDEKLKEIVLDQIGILNESWKKKLPPLPAPQNSWQAKYCNFHKQCLKQKNHLDKEPLFYKN